MTEWFVRYWWLLFGLAASGSYVAWRMHTDRAEGSFLRRVLYALFPALNPESAERRQLTPHMIWLVAIGLLLVSLLSLFRPG